MFYCEKCGFLSDYPDNNLPCEYKSSPFPLGASSKLTWVSGIYQSTHDFKVIPNDWDIDLTTKKLNSCIICNECGKNLNDNSLGSCGQLFGYKLTFGHNFIFKEPVLPRESDDTDVFDLD
jgi:hypothetical protein